MKLFKPKSGSKGFFNKDSLAIVDIKNIDGTDGIVVTYKDGSQVVYENYDKVVDRKGLVKETFATALSLFEKFKPNNAIANKLQVGDIIYYNEEFVVVDNNLLSELIEQFNEIDTTYKLDIFGDGSCIACYTFDGNANDLSGNHNGVWKDKNGNIIDGQYQDGKFGQAADFPNDQRYVDLGNDIIYGIDTITVSGWIYIRSFPQTWANPLICQDNGNDKRYLQCTTYNKKLCIHTFGAGEDAVDTEELQTNQWYFLTFIVGSNGGKIYKNGVLVAETDYSFSFGNDIPVTIGRKRIDDQWTDGLIDQVRIFNRALTEEEIQILYNEQTTPLIKKLSF